MTIGSDGLPAKWFTGVLLHMSDFVLMIDNIRTMEVIFLLALILVLLSFGRIGPGIKQLASV